MAILTRIDYNGRCLTEEWVSTLGVVSSFLPTVVAILVARVTDRVRGRMKASILALLTVAGGCFTLLSLVSAEVQQDFSPQNKTCSGSLKQALSIEIPSC